LLVLLERDWGRSLDDFMRTARKSLTEQLVERADRIEQAPQVLRSEASLLSELKIDLERLEWFYALYLEDAKMSDQFPATSAEFAARLRALHARTKERISSGRPLGRKKKKRRKREVARAVVSMVVGAGAFVTNTHMPAFMAWSYALGGSALHQAARDLAGQKGD
jgi:hypothetical protein